jgi:hypothetical protein
MNDRPTPRHPGQDDRRRWKHARRKTHPERNDRRPAPRQ